MAANGGGDGDGVIGRRGRVIYTDDKRERSSMRLENPFTFKVLQVFTGFGIGCGVGIGVGRPIQLGAIPVAGQVMTAARGATDAFSGVQRIANNSLKKVGAKNIEVGIGCGVGFGHGFGVGLALKPSVLHKIQSQFMHVATNLMERIGMDSSSTAFVNQGTTTPLSLESGKSRINESSQENRSISHLVKSASNNRNGTSASTNTEYTSRTEKVLDNFLKDLKDEGSLLRQQAGASQLENNLLQMVLKHQVQIDELMRENEKFRQILVDVLKVQPSSLQSSSTSKSNFSCTECFECRRRQRRR